MKKIVKCDERRKSKILDRIILNLKKLTNAVYRLEFHI